MSTQEKGFIIAALQKDYEDKAKAMKAAENKRNVRR